MLRSSPEGMSEAKHGGDRRLRSNRNAQQLAVDVMLLLHLILLLLLLVVVAVSSCIGTGCGSCIGPRR